MLILSLFAVVALTGAPPKPCHDAKGHPTPCPAASLIASHCHDAKGREVKCGTPGARPAGLKTEKPRPRGS